MSGSQLQKTSTVPSRWETRELVMLMNEDEDEDVSPVEFMHPVFIACQVGVVVGDSGLCYCVCLLNV